MKIRGLFVAAMVSMFSYAAFAQTKTITNLDLEKYKQARLNAERELRENYKELGFPSPEELEKQNEESRKALSELSQRLREERLAREAIEAERDNSGDYSAPSNDPADFIDYQQYFGATYSYPGHYRNRVYNNRPGFGKSGIRINQNGNRFRGVFRTGTNKNRRNTNFGPSRRLTRQNQIKSRQSDIRSTIRARSN
ncbi:MAG: hypothetical protein R2681_02155 [Pyrinomonadaceae bacterium]